MGFSIMETQVYDMEAVTSSFSQKEYDFFILAPNIEKRSRAFFLNYASLLSIKKTICADYENFHTDLSPTYEKEFWNDFDGHDYISFSVENDKSFLKKLSGEKILPNDSVAVDMTGFSIPAIYELMHFLKNNCEVKNVDVYYTEPKLYLYEDGYFDAYHGSVKHRTTSVVPGYFCSGEDQREVLTIFLGFDGGLAHSVYSRLAEEGQEIVRAVAVNGFPSYMAKLKDVSLFNNESLISQLSRRDLFYSTANNPFDVYNTICRIHSETEGILLNLCSIGAKPMALGACLYALDHKGSVKVTYPYYIKTRFDYEEEAGKMWRYRVCF